MGSPGKPDQMALRVGEPFRGRRQSGSQDFTWQGRWSEPTEVEVRFSPEGTGTRVDLEHRGRERLGAVSAQSRTAYLNGWLAALQRYVGCGASLGRAPDR